MKKGILIFTLFIIILFPILSIAGDTNNLFGTVVETSEDTQPEPTPKTDSFETSDIPLVETEETSYYDIENYENEIQVSTIPKDSNIKTSQGTISQFSITNALFSLGSLVQGSFISFENNNTNM